MDNNENNIKDTKQVSFHLKDNVLPYFYNKTKKLIIALFMVTDIMDKEDPLRNKLRDLGLEIMSDSYTNLSRTDFTSIELANKTSLLLSFIDIGNNIQTISDMNSNILKREFLLFKDRIEGKTKNKNPMSSDLLFDFFNKEEEEEEEEIKDDNITNKDFSIGHKGQYKNENFISIGHKGQNNTSKGSIGLQKGSTLLKALKEIENKSFNKNNKDYLNLHDKNKVNFKNKTKKERQEEIVKILKDNREGLNISEIKSFATGELSTLSEKTLQRVLVSMVFNNVLYKKGEKRWSRYFVK